MEKSVRNVDAIARKLRPASTRASNYRLEVAREKRQKKEEIVEKRKIKAMVAKYCRDKREISLFSKEEGNYESDTGDDTDPD